MNMRTLSALALGTLLGFIATPGHASLIAYDDFESYSTGSSLVGQNGGTGWGAWSGLGTGITVESGVIPTRGNSLQVAGTSQLDKVISRAFANQTDTVYLGMLIRTGGTFDGTAPAEQDFVQTYLNSGGTSSQGASTGTKNEAGSPIFARVGASSNNVNSSINATSLPLETYQVVLKIEDTAAFGGNYDRASVFVGQLSEGSPDAVSNANAGTGTLNAFNIRTFSLEAGDEFYIDELRIATTYAEALAPVPEPTAVLGLLGLITGTFFRRRRRTLA